VKIDKSKLGNLEYGINIENELKPLYIGKKIVNVKYDYFAESFYVILDDGEKLEIDIE
jgi:hypothetical protein